MKGEILTTKDLSDRGFKFYCYFAGLHVYKKTDDIYIEYVFYDTLKKEIVSTLKTIE